MERLTHQPDFQMTNKRRDEGVLSEMKEGVSEGWSQVFYLEQEYKRNAW